MAIGLLPKIDCSKPAPILDRDIMFKGLYATIEYLCSLDGVENVMELYKRFDFTADKKRSKALY